MSGIYTDYIIRINSIGVWSISKYSQYVIGNIRCQIQRMRNIQSNTLPPQCIQIPLHCVNMPFCYAMPLRNAIHDTQTETQSVIPNGGRI